MPIVCVNEFLFYLDVKYPFIFGFVIKVEICYLGLAIAAPSVAPGLDLTVVVRE